MDNTRLIEAAVNLRAAAPNEWENFVRVMREYAASVATDVLRSAPDVLLRSQGYAIGVTELSSTLRNAPQLFETIRTRQDAIRRTHSGAEIRS
jgi:hypothetical protein